MSNPQPTRHLILRAPIAGVVVNGVEQEPMPNDARTMVDFSLRVIQEDASAEGPAEPNQGLRVGVIVDTGNMTVAQAASLLHALLGEMRDAVRQWTSPPMSGEET